MEGHKNHCASTSISGQLPLEQCTGCIVGKTLLIHRTVKTIGLMNPCLDEELVMPYIANLYRHHKKINIILL